MKKIVAIALTTAMLFALAVPAFAAAWGWISDVNNTTNFIVSSERELPVNAGKIPDGVDVTLGGAQASPVWQCAYPYLLDRTYTPGRYDGAADIDVYLMYDSKALYIREVRRDELTLAGADVTNKLPYGKYDAAVYTILLPNIVMGTTKDTKTPVGAQIKIYPSWDSAATRPVPCETQANKMSYAFLTDANGNKAQGNTDDLRGLAPMAGVTSYTRPLTKTADGTITSYEIETAILWSQIDPTFVPTEDTVLGFIHYLNVGNGGSYKTVNSAGTGHHDEWDNFAALCLRGVNVEANSYKIDMSWYNDADTEFTLTTAGQLRGLAYLVGSQASLDAAKAITANKTFKLGADIDLNPGWTTDSQTPPLYYWMPIGAFAGTFDGQGHEISNMICVPTWNIKTFTAKSYESWERNMGLIGYGFGNITIKNLAITDSEVSSNFSAAGLMAVVMAGAKVNINNVYVDADVKADTRTKNPTYSYNNNYSFAGILIGRGLSSEANWATVENAVCAGSLTLIVRNGSGVSGVGSGPVWGTAESSSTGKIDNVLVALSSNTATGYQINTNTLEEGAASDQSWRTKPIANSGSWTETNTVYANPTTGALTKDSNATTNCPGDYPTDWVDAGNVKLPSTVANMMKRNLWVQRSNVVEGETEFGVRILTVIDAYRFDGSQRIKVEMSVDGGAYEELSTEIDTQRYLSVIAAGETRNAASLNGKYILTTKVSNLPASGTVMLRITPMDDSGNAPLINVPSAVITYDNGVVRTNV